MSSSESSASALLRFHPKQHETINKNQLLFLHSPKKNKNKKKKFLLGLQPKRLLANSLPGAPQKNPRRAAQGCLGGRMPKASVRLGRWAGAKKQGPLTVLDLKCFLKKQETAYLSFWSKSK